MNTALQNHFLSLNQKNMKSVITVIGLIISIVGFSQEIPYPSLSPKGSIEQVIGNTTFKIEYERPSVRGRVIFGELVPFGKVWRTGAGNCTKISFDRLVTIFKQQIPAGTYSLLTKPNQNEWMIMINKDTTLYGSRDYKSSEDVIQIIAEPTKTKRMFETMTFDIEMVDNHAVISLSWERTQVSFKMETTTNDEVNALIKSRLLTKESKDADEYFGGAAFLLSLKDDLPIALELVEQAIALDSQSEAARNLKIKLCEKLEKYQEALDEIDSHVSLLRSKGNRMAEIKALEEDRIRIEKLKKKAKK